MYVYDWLLFVYFLKDFIYLFLGRGEGKEKERVPMLNAALRPAGGCILTVDGQISTAVFTLLLWCESPQSPAQALETRPLQCRDHRRSCPLRAVQPSQGTPTRHPLCSHLAAPKACALLISARRRSRQLRATSTGLALSSAFQTRGWDQQVGCGINGISILKN